MEEGFCWGRGIALSVSKVITEVVGVESWQETSTALLS